MQTFRDTADGSVWALEADVVVTEVGGSYSFETAAGVAGGGQAGTSGYMQIIEHVF